MYDHIANPRALFLRGSNHREASEVDSNHQRGRGRRINLVQVKQDEGGRRLPAGLVDACLAGDQRYREREFDRSILPIRSYNSPECVYYTHGLWTFFYAYRKR